MFGEILEFMMRWKTSAGLPAVAAQIRQVFAMPGTRLTTRKEIVALVSVHWRGCLQRLQRWTGVKPGTAESNFFADKRMRRCRDESAAIIVVDGKG